MTREGLKSGLVEGARERTPRTRTFHITRALELVAFATNNLQLSTALGQGYNVIRFCVARAHTLAASVTSIVPGFEILASRKYPQARAWA